MAKNLTIFLRYFSGNCWHENLDDIAIICRHKNESLPPLLSTQDQLHEHGICSHSRSHNWKNATQSLMLCGCYLEIHDHLSLNLCFVRPVLWGPRPPLFLPLPSDQDLLGDGGGLGVGARRSDWSNQVHAPWGLHRQGKEAEFSHLAGSCQAFRLATWKWWASHLPLSRCLEILGVKVAVLSGAILHGLGWQALGEMPDSTSGGFRPAAGARETSAASGRTCADLWLRVSECTHVWVFPCPGSATLSSNKQTNHKHLDKLWERPQKEGKRFFLLFVPEPRIFKLGPTNFVASSISTWFSLNPRLW